MEKNSLLHPRKSHRKSVNLPEYSSKLAEFFGIMLGDGGINNPWQANITLNSVSDEMYAEYIVDLCDELFEVQPAVRTRKGKQALLISLASITIVDFLVDNGLPRGNKLKSGLGIPKWILKEQRYRTACVRGLVDTDGCLYIHRHCVAQKKYRNIGLCFCSHSPKLIKQVSSIFEEFGIIPHISNDRRNIYLYRESAVAKYLDIFGTSNERIESVYRNWRRG